MLKTVDNKIADEFCAKLVDGLLSVSWFHLPIFTW